MSHCPHHVDVGTRCPNCHLSYITTIKAKAHAWWDQFAPMMPADISQLDRMDGVGRTTVDVRPGKDAE